MGKPVWTPEMVETLIAMRAAGHTMREVGEKIGMTTDAVSSKCERIRVAGTNVGREPRVAPVSWKDEARAATITLGLAVRAYVERRAA